MIILILSSSFWKSYKPRDTEEVKNVDEAHADCGQADGRWWWLVYDDDDGDDDDESVFLADDIYVNEVMILLLMIT